MSEDSEYQVWYAVDSEKVHKHSSPQQSQRNAFLPSSPFTVTAFSFAAFGGILLRWLDVDTDEREMRARVSVSSVEYLFVEYWLGVD